MKNQTTQYISDVGPSGPFVGAIYDRWNPDNRLYNTFFRIPITKENSTCRNDALPKARYGHGFCGFFSGVDCAVQLKFAGITFHNPESRARSDSRGHSLRFTLHLTWSVRDILEP